MLPLLPALILLLLNGPANLERMAEHGALPKALQAIHQRSLDNDQKLDSAKADQFALASLLSLTGDPQLSSALAQIFSIQVAAEAQPVSSTFSQAESDDSDPPPVDRTIGTPQRGFLSSQRSRDGPLSC